MKRTSKIPTTLRVFTAVLIALVGLAILGWFADPAHRSAGESRVPGAPASVENP